MGMFDISTQKKSYNLEKKDDIIYSLKDRFAETSYDVEIENEKIILKKFKAKKTFLSYDLSMQTTTNSEYFTIDFEGELQNVWILVILIVLGIMLSYGMGAVLVAIFAFYQKKAATVYIENCFEEIKKEASQE